MQKIDLLVANSTCAHAEGEGTSALAAAAHSEGLRNYCEMALRHTLRVIRVSLLVAIAMQEAERLRPQLLGRQRWETALSPTSNTLLS